MEDRILGNTELSTAPIVFGGNVFGWTLNQEQSFEILDEFVGSGFNTIDTADVYSRWADGNQGGESETIIGKWLRSRGIRDQVNIITKVGSDMGQGNKELTEDYILKAADASLKRLGVDHIDLYLTHWDDDKTPVEETLGAYGKLIEAGKVRYIGASNLSLERLSASLAASEKHNLPRYEVFQPEYNLYDREGFEQGVSSLCHDEGLGVITYSSLASGFLTGKYRGEDDLDQSVRGSGVKKYLDKRGTAIVEVLDDLAEKHKASPAGVALAWLLHQPIVSAPIASATRTKHLASFIEAAEMDLSSGDLEQLKEASSYAENA